jgi:tetratricopeptide (TPR) repeat protein
MRAKAVFVLVLAVFLLASCVSTTQRAQQALDSGDYRAAIEHSLAALKENASDPEAKAVLASAWNRANAEWRTQTEQLLEAESAQENREALSYFEALISIHEMVSSAGQNSLNPDAASLKAEYEDARKRVADAYRNEGSTLYYKGTIESAREAVGLFETAVSIYPPMENEFGYMLENALEKATVRVFVFFGPDTNFGLNANRMVPHIENLLDEMKFVEAVRVPNRYAAPVDDDHGAKDFARGHRAELMLHIEPDTAYSVQLKNEATPISSVPTWGLESTYLQASGVSNLRIVLIDLSDDSVIEDMRVTAEYSQRSDAVLTAVTGPRRTETIQITGMSAPRSLVIQKAPAGMNHMTLVYNLTNTAGIDLPSWGFETGAEPLTTAPSDLSTISSLGDVENIARLDEHTFFLSDLIEMDQYGDGSLSYQYTYGMYEGPDNEGRIATSVKERNLYERLKSVLTSNQSRNEFSNAFVTRFYETKIGESAVKAISGKL